MDDHFAAFSFVDRIREFTPGARGRGSFEIPAAVASFPGCLVAEAVGQLAAWVAMAHIGFRGRPVAALALDTRFLLEAKPGQTLELAVELESCDDEAVAYRGWAEIDGTRIIELNDCLGPMLPLEEFDSPAALRERLDVLRGPGAVAGRYHGIGDFRVEPGALVPGKAAAATLQVPASAPFFGDHFPRRPVFPATLLLNEMIRLALTPTRDSTKPGSVPPVVPLRMTNVKVRSFTPPGQALQLAAELAGSAAGVTVASLSARAEGRMVATARVDLGCREEPGS
jgi:3-hydroxymyristoyl/3-hydroxydecanoyl-(acyl carrier protein) dehydratase